MIADNIKALRKAIGLTQAEFAERLGVTSGVITNLEYGRLQEPEKKMPLFRLIAKEFGVSIDWLLNGEGEPELSGMTEAEKEAQLMGQMIASDDPVVRSFLQFWSERTAAERRQLAQMLIDFADRLKTNMEEK